MRRLPRRMFAIGSAGGLLLVCSAVPGWTAWHVGPWEMTGSAGSLWTVLEAIPWNAAEVGWPEAAVVLPGGAWMTVAVILVVGAHVGLGVHAELLRRRRRLGLCLTCGYDLRASPGRCPECGRVTGKPELSR